jgi:hypothetical protein
MDGLVVAGRRIAAGLQVNELTCVIQVKDMYVLEGLPCVPRTSVAIRAQLVLGTILTVHYILQHHRLTAPRMNFTWATQPTSK